MCNWDDYRLWCIHNIREGLDSHDCPDCQAIAKKLGRDISNGKTWIFTKDPYEKCHYCDFKYLTEDEFGKHLNEKHVRCICGTMFDVDDFDDNLALCEDCRDD